MSTLLDQVSSLVTIDVDSMDPAVAARHATPGSGLFTDMTSNQAIAYGAMILPENSALVQRAIILVRVKSPNIKTSELVDDVLDTITVLLAKQVYPYLIGNVHAQTSPSAAYDTEKTVHHAQKLVALFAEHGITKDRVCIKIPVTPESAIACAQLSDMGIQTLGTCLFSVPQALAASQARCLYVAPYFNELRVHFEPSLWKAYETPNVEHPMSPVIRSIVLLYREISSKTLIMPASIVTAKEVIGLTSLEPNHLTISGSVLNEMATLDAVPADRFKAPEGIPVPEDVKTKDYLANGAVNLKHALGADAESTRKLADALKIFWDLEEKSKVFIKSLLVV